ncbi:MAG: TetR/AcrR family transcriptional regulator [Treponema sp.]|nr:TetR/AcrR family transcriptional regulator [Treponema sp.]
MNNDIHSVETKIKMGSALKELIKTKSFQKITVGDVVAFCEINRNTFYYHFENMYDLLYWTYEQEIKNILDNYQSAEANILQAFDFILSYIDSNILLCQTAYESLGENELKNMLDRDLKLFVASSINFILENNKKAISEDFRNFLIFNFTTMLGGQIVWYIKYNEQLDKAKFLDYIQIALFGSLEATILEASKKNL